jgi:Fic family protein
MSWTVSFPPRIDLANPELLRLLARAQALADVIRHVPLPPRTKEKFNRLNILRAVRGTTCIEGAELSESEVEAVVAAGTEHVLPPSRQVEETEARNAFDVMQFIAQSVRLSSAHPLTPSPSLLPPATGEAEAVVTEALICELHRRMTHDIPYPQNQPGKYRTLAVRVDRYRPPPPEQVPELMQQFLAWFNAAPCANWDRVVRAVVAHFYLVSIHPFADGNGRTGRALESFILYQAGINSRGFYSLANYYYRLRTEYFQHLDQARTPGTDLTPLVLFAARGLVDELEGVCREVLAQVRLIAFRDYVRGLLSRAKNLRPTNRGRLQRFVLGLLEFPKPGVPLAQLRAGEGLLAALYEGKSPSTLTRDLKFLSANRLIAIEDGHVRANLGLMTEFEA